MMTLAAFTSKLDRKTLESTCSSVFSGAVCIVAEGWHCGASPCSSFFTFSLFPETRVVAVCDIDSETLKRVAKEHEVAGRYVKYAGVGG